MDIIRNKNKIVELTRVGGGTEEQRSWRNNIAFIIGKQSEEDETAGPADVKNYMFSDMTTVSSEVKLLLDTEPKKFHNTVGMSTPVSDFFKKVPSMGKFGAVASGIAKVINLADTVINAAETSFTEGPGKTSLQITPWMTDLKSWNGTYNSPGGLSFTFTFVMGQYGLWNAKEEVVKPAFNLIAPVFPQYLDAIHSRGPIPNTANLATNLVSNLFKKDDESNSGASEAEEADSGWLAKVGRGLDELLLSGYESFVWNLKVGSIIEYKRLLMKDAGVQFSKETDEKGYPIGATVEVSFESTMPMALTSDSAEHMSVRFGVQS